MQPLIAGFIVLAIAVVGVCNAEDEKKPTVTSGLPLEKQIGINEEAVVRLVQRSIEKQESITVVDLENCRPFVANLGAEATKGTIGKEIRVLYDGNPNEHKKPGDSYYLYRKTRHTRLILIAGNWILHCEDAEKIIMSTLASMKQK